MLFRKLFLQISMELYSCRNQKLQKTKTNTVKPTSIQFQSYQTGVEIRWLNVAVFQRRSLEQRCLDRGGAKRVVVFGPEEQVMSLKETRDCISMQSHMKKCSLDVPDKLFEILLYFQIVMHKNPSLETITVSPRYMMTKISSTKQI